MLSYLKHSVLLSNRWQCLSTAGQNCKAVLSCLQSEVCDAYQIDVYQTLSSFLYWQVQYCWSQPVLPRYCWVLARVFSTWRQHGNFLKLWLNSALKYVWKQLRREMDIEVTYSWFKFDQDCLVWCKFIISFTAFFCWVLWRLTSTSVALPPSAGLSLAPSIVALQWHMWKGTRRKSSWT